MGNRIDVEQILIREQIKFIEREIANIKDFYCHRYIDSFGREYDIDLAWFHIETKFEQLVDEAKSSEEKLNYCKMMYQECLDLIYDEIENRPVPLLYEKDLCGSDSVLVVYEE